MKHSLTLVLVLLCFSSCMTTTKAVNYLKTKNALADACKDNFPCKVDTVSVISFDEDWEAPPCVHDFTGCVLCPGALDTSGKVIPVLPLECPLNPKPKVIRTIVTVSVKDSAEATALRIEISDLQKSLSTANETAQLNKVKYDACIKTGRAIGSKSPSLKLLWYGILIGLIGGILLRAVLKRTRLF